MNEQREKITLDDIKKMSEKLDSINHTESEPIRRIREAEQKLIHEVLETALGKELADDPSTWKNLLKEYRWGEHLNYNLYYVTNKLHLGEVRFEFLGSTNKIYFIPNKREEL
jgi:hypothetical protein